MHSKGPGLKSGPVILQRLSPKRSEERDGLVEKDFTGVPRVHHARNYQVVVPPILLNGTCYNKQAFYI